MLQVALGSVSVKVTPDARAGYLSGRFHRNCPAIGYGTPSSPPDQLIALQDCFGGVALGGLPFNVCLVPGDASARHEGRANTKLFCVVGRGRDAEIVGNLVVHEASEVFMADQDRGWDCGHSNGEALASLLAFERHPVSGFESAFAWLDSLVDGPRSRAGFGTDWDGAVSW